MIKILGVLDMISSIAIILIPFKISIPYITIFAAIYLMVKALIFITDPVSWLDLTASIALFLYYFSLFTMPRIPSFILAFIVFQKGLFSLLS